MSLLFFECERLGVLAADLLLPQIPIEFRCVLAPLGGFNEFEASLWTVVEELLEEGAV